MKKMNSKLKPLYIGKILLENSDEQHGMTLNEIMDCLEEVGIPSERKSLYDDMNKLRDNGIMDIGTERDGRTCRYYIRDRVFDTVELQLLVDAVQHAKFISIDKSQMLIDKITSLGSKYEKNALLRRVHMVGRIKTQNAQVLIGVNTILEAISDDVSISFFYSSYYVSEVSKGFEKILKKNGERYIVSPYALVWDDENYYMVGYDSETGLKKHYRVDKMTYIKPTGSAREGKEEFKNFNIAKYCRQAFSMYGGDESRVMLECDNDMISVIIDRFGEEIVVLKKNGCFTVNVQVQLSKIFYSWIFSFGGKVRLISPESAVRAYENQLKSTLTAQNALKTKIDIHN